MKAVLLSTNKEAIRNVYPDSVRALISQKAELAEADVHSNLADVDFIFSTWGMPHLSREFICDKLPNLKAVFYGAGSVQGFAREFLEENRIVVSAWGANAVPVAEFTVAQILLANKGYFQRFQHTSCEKWTNRRLGGNFDGNYHAKIGLIGAGMVGRAVIGLLKNFIVDIYVFDPFLSEEKAAQLGVQKAPLEYIFSECSVISNHLANNPQTVGMLNYSLFSKMKPNAAFINTGRGAQVVEADLCRAMEECPDRIALLDVTDPEPPADNSMLYKLENIFLSPHIAGGIGAEVQRMGMYMYEEFASYLAGQPLRYAVSLEMLKTMA